MHSWRIYSPSEDANYIGSRFQARSAANFPSACDGKRGEPLPTKDHETPTIKETQVEASSQTEIANTDVVPCGLPEMMKSLDEAIKRVENPNAIPFPTAATEAALSASKKAALAMDVVFTLSKPADDKAQNHLAVARVSPSSSWAPSLQKFPHEESLSPPPCGAPPPPPPLPPPASPLASVGTLPLVQDSNESNQFLSLQAPSGQAPRIQEPNKSDHFSSLVPDWSPDSEQPSSVEPFSMCRVCSKAMQRLCNAMVGRDSTEWMMDSSFDSAFEDHSHRNDTVTRTVDEIIRNERCVLDLQLNYVKQEVEETMLEDAKGCHEVEETKSGDTKQVGDNYETQDVEETRIDAENIRECSRSGTADLVQMDTSEEESVIEAFLSKQKDPKKPSPQDEARQRWVNWSAQEPRIAEALPNRHLKDHVAPIHDSIISAQLCPLQSLPSAMNTLTRHVPIEPDMPSQAGFAQDDDLFEIRWGEEGDEHHCFTRIRVEVLHLDQEAALKHALSASESWCCVGSTGKLVFNGFDEAFNVLFEVQGESCITKTLPAHIGSAQRPARVHIGGLPLGSVVAVRLRPFVRTEGAWGTAFSPILLARSPGGRCKITALDTLRARMETPSMSLRGKLQLEISAVEADSNS